MRCKPVALSLIALIIGGVIAGVPSSPAAALGAAAHADVESDEGASVTLPVCSFDNFNRIIGYKKLIANLIVLGKVFATPTNGPVFGNLTSTPNPGINLTIVDPSAPGTFHCKGVGFLPQFSGTCKIGQQTLPWGSIPTTCPPGFP